MIRLYIGKSGAGKDYFLNKDVNSGKFKRIVSFTTRPPRPKETDGVDYVFLSKDEFDKAEKMETRSYETEPSDDGIKETWYYGSPLLKDYILNDYVGVVDIAGAEKYITRYGKENVEIVYVEADDALRKERAESRGGFVLKEWNRRLEDDSVKFSPENVYRLFGKVKKFKTITNNFERKGA